MKLAIQKILNSGKRRIGFLGMAFKPNTDDLRESPLVEVIETLLGKGCTIQIYDRHVSMSRLIGANKRFIDEHIPHLSALLVQELDALLAQSEVIVVGYQSPEFGAVLQRLRPDQMVIDLAHVARPVNMTASYDGLCW
jgi:GDP-mannose 6-dehydrogenase